MMGFGKKKMGDYSSKVSSTDASQERVKVLELKKLIDKTLETKAVNKKQSKIYIPKILLKDEFRGIQITKLVDKLLKQWISKKKKFFKYKEFARKYGVLHQLYYNFDDMKELRFSNDVFYNMSDNQVVSMILFEFTKDYLS